MKITRVKTTIWYEIKHGGMIYNVRKFAAKGENGLPVNDITIYHGDKQVVDFGLTRIITAALLLHEGM